MPGIVRAGFDTNPKLSSSPNGTPPSLTALLRSFSNSD